MWGIRARLCRVAVLAPVLTAAIAVTAAVAVGETCRSAQSSFVCETAPLPAAAQPEPPGGGEGSG